MGDEVLTFRRFQDVLMGRAARLSERSLAGFFALVTDGLLGCVTMPADLVALLEDAVARGLRYASTGAAEGGDGSVARRLVEFPYDDEESGCVMTAATCARLAVDRFEASKPSDSVEMALWPIMATASLMLYEDVSDPGSDEERDEVFHQPLVQRAVDYLTDMMAALEASPEPSGELLEGLRAGAVALAPPDGAPIV
jgi:hypothetical protein